jgi:hypothetical protein
MFRALLVVVLAGAAAALVPAGVADAKAKPKCAPKGSRTLLRTTAVRVYEVGDIDRTIFGCLLGNGRRKAVATYSSCDCSTSDDPTPRTWVARDTVALNAYSCPPIGFDGACAGSVFSYDLRHRARKFQENVPKGYVAQLVLKPNGAFAYVDGDGEVRKVDGAGPAELDAGPVEPRSLARANSIVYWTKAGQPYSARLQ